MQRFHVPADPLATADLVKHLFLYTCGSLLPSAYVRHFAAEQPWHDRTSFERQMADWNRLCHVGERRRAIIEA